MSVCELQRRSDKSVLKPYPRIPVNSVDDIVRYIQTNSPIKDYTIQNKAPGFEVILDRNYFFIDLYLEPEHKNFGFYVMDKLEYAMDIKKYCDEKFGGLISYNTVFKADVPIIFSGFKTVRYNSMAKTIVVRDAFLKYVRETETIVDKNLNQIWPVATGRPPVNIIQLLKQTTEQAR